MSFLKRKYVLIGIPILIIIVIGIIVFFNLSTKNPETGSSLNQKPISLPTISTDKGLGTTNDTLTKFNQTNGDPTHNQNIEEKKNSEKPNTKTSSKSFLVKIAVIFSKGFKGSYDKYDFVKAKHNRYGTSLLFVYEKGILDTIHTYKSLENLTASNLESYRILFPKTEALNNGNEICNILPGKNDNFEVQVNENKGSDNCGIENESVFYEFDSDMNLKTIRFNEKFSESYRNNHISNPDEINQKMTDLSEKLKYSLKYWNGREYTSKQIHR